MENNYSITNVLGVALVALIVGLTCGAAFLSASDTKPDAYHIDRWTTLNMDTVFRSMKPEDRIEIMVTYIAEGADPRPAWRLVTEMLTEAYADIYAAGFVDCQEECEKALDQAHAVYSMMDGN